MLLQQENIQESGVETSDCGGVFPSLDQKVWRYNKLLSYPDSLLVASIQELLHCIEKIKGRRQVL